jgi:predicted nucleotidyltransferase
MYNFSRDPRFIEPYYSKTNRIFIDDAMKEIGIPKHLKNIEKEYNIRILLAVESGSRAWGFASTNSDWDVRFVYVHKPEWYLSVEPQPNVIGHMFDDDVDLVGWELRKALSLFGRSNPSLFEWLNLPQVYYMDKEFESRLKEVEATFLNPIKNMYHYNHIYNKHNERYLQHEKCELKRFLYYLRGILACKWIEQNNTLRY